MGETGEAAVLPQELLRRKRLGEVLTAAEIDSIASGIADGRLDDAQVGAFAMAVCVSGMNAAEVTALTVAMRDTGQVIDWRALGFDAPVLDKHSTGGIGDVVTLMLGPMLAACGACMPLLSGRGLGHTGGTLDKLEAIPGYCGVVSIERICAVLRTAGVAIVGAGGELAPADRRLYSIRDVTGTVDSIALITASILSKKLAANTDALILDIKTGSGAFMPSLAAANELARSLVKVANRAGLPTRALTTDMNQSLAPAVGNALETRLALRYLRNDERPQRLHELTLRLGSELLHLAGMAADLTEGEARLLHALDSGEAAERFARMVAALGGPNDVLAFANKGLPTAPVIGPVFAERPGLVAGMDARALGLAVVALGGGRTRPGAPIDPSVGLDQVAEIGMSVDGERPLAIIHAADADSFARAAAQVRAAFLLDNHATPPPLIYQCIGAEDVEDACAAHS